MGTLRKTIPARTRRAGFSLVELMVVVVILGLLATVVLFAVGGEVDSARQAQREAQMEQIYQAIQRYSRLCDQRGIRPTLPGTLEDLIEGPQEWQGRWEPPLRNIPDNPWGHPYEYVVDDENAGYFTLICYGRNGREGGEEVYDEDIRMSHPPQRD